MSILHTPLCDLLNIEMPIIQATIGPGPGLALAASVQCATPEEPEIEPPTQARVIGKVDSPSPGPTTRVSPTGQKHSLRDRAILCPPPG